MSSSQDITPPVGVSASPLIGWIPGPSVVIKTERHEEPLWCFGCRQRLPGTFVLLDDPPERQPSYYDPEWAYRCDGCGVDRRHFPGCDPL